MATWPGHASESIVSDVNHDDFTFNDLPLIGGGKLGQVTLADVTRGRLAPNGRNAILVASG